MTLKATSGVIQTDTVKRFDMVIRLKRAYEAATEDDGYRVLVDRVWPRGVAKADARLDAWHKELAPSKELRQWFGHDRARWHEFSRAYRAELEAADQKTIEALRTHAEREGLTLVFAARDRECNNAVALKAYLEASS